MGIKKKKRKEGGEVIAMSSDFHTSITRRPRVQGKRVIPPRYWIRRDNNSTGIFSPGKGEGKPWRSLSFGNLRMPRGFQFELIKGSDSRSPTKRNPPSSFSFFLSFFLSRLYTFLIHAFNHLSLRPSYKCKLRYPVYKETIRGGRL